MTMTLNTIRHNADGTVSEGTITIPDPGPVRQRPQPTTISAASFYARFTDAEKAGIAAASIAAPAIFVGLVHGLVNGTVDLTAPELHAWMDGFGCGGCDHR
jgi:hypothetical protein